MIQHHISAESQGKRGGILDLTPSKENQKALRRFLSFFLSFLAS